MQRRWLKSLPIFRYKKSDNEFMSEGLKKVLKRQGFDD